MPDSKSDQSLDRSLIVETESVFNALQIYPVLPSGDVDEPQRSSMRWLTNDKLGMELLAIVKSTVRLPA